MIGTAQFDFYVLKFQCTKDQVNPLYIQCIIYHDFQQLNGYEGPTGRCRIYPYVDNCICIECGGLEIFLVQYFAYIFEKACIVTAVKKKGQLFTLKKGIFFPTVNLI